MSTNSKDSIECCYYECLTFSNKHLLFISIYKFKKSWDYPLAKYITTQISFDFRNENALEFSMG